MEFYLEKRIITSCSTAIPHRMVKERKRKTIELNAKTHPDCAPDEP